MRIMIALIILITLVGCGTARVTGTGPTWTELRCQRLMDQRDGATWGAAFAGGLGGVGGLVTAFPENDNVRLGLGISAAVVGALATSLTVLAKMKSGEFEQGCAVALEPMTSVPALEPGDAPIAVEVIRADDAVDVEWEPVDGGVEP